MTADVIRTESTRGVCTITLHRPDVLNAITPEMLRELRAAVLAAGDDEDVGVIVLTGEGRAFSAGVDLKALGDRKLASGARRQGPRCPFGTPCCLRPGQWFPALEHVLRIRILQLATLARDRRRTASPPDEWADDNESRPC